jgi:hypothetical protein
MWFGLDRCMSAESTGDLFEDNWKKSLIRMHRAAYLFAGMGFLIVYSGKPV